MCFLLHVYVSTYILYTVIFDFIHILQAAHKVAGKPAKKELRLA